MGEKTCVINQYSVIYARAKCAVVCFDSAVLIDAVIETILVLKGAKLHWFYLSSAKCAKCGNLDYTFLDCFVSENAFPGGSTHKILLDNDKNRLVSIYVKCSAPISYPVFFGGVLWANIVGGSSFSPLFVHNGSAASGSFSEKKPTPMVPIDLNNRFVALEHSLVSLAEHVDKLAKRLNLPGPMVSQPSPGCQLLVISLSQNQEVNIVISESSGVVTGSETIAGVAVFGFLVIFKMEETLNNLSITVISLLAKIDNTSLVSAVYLFQ
ncbi:hypothetical protein G9A89_014642 [Geosiphon pyriformis]|nr:hypothetical protein G9A89_014642 [Geosiphon pyriformis]